MSVLVSVLDWIRASSILLSEFVRQIIFVALAFSWVSWNESQQTTVLTAVSALLALITSKTTVPSSRIDSITHSRVQDILASPEGVIAGTEGKGTGAGGSGAGNI